MGVAFVKRILSACSHVSVSVFASASISLSKCIGYPVEGAMQVIVFV